MFRRSGSVVAYFVDGRIPNGEELQSKLAANRFRTIENAASEETSIGWVTAGDPTGDTFELEDMDLDASTWLRIRVDTKKLPAAWMAIHRSVAERSAGKKLSARERKELKEDLSQKLLPRVLPSVQFIDALYLPKQSRLLLFATSSRIREEFEKLFFRTFATPIVQADPYTLATHAGLDRDQAAYLEEVAPVPWPRDGKTEMRKPLEVEADEPIAEIDDAPSAAAAEETEVTEELS